MDIGTWTGTNVNIELDEEIDEGFSCLFEEKRFGGAFPL